MAYQLSAAGDAGVRGMLPQITHGINASRYRDDGRVYLSGGQNVGGRVADNVNDRVLAAAAPGLGDSVPKNIFAQFVAVAERTEIEKPAQSGGGNLCPPDGFEIS